MTEYGDGVRNSLVNLSDEEIFFRLKNNYYTQEAKEIVQAELKRRGAHIKSETEKNESKIIYETLVSEARIKKFKNGNALIWAVSLFMFGVAQVQIARTSPPLANGILWVLIGFPIYLLIVKIKNTKLTEEALLKKYKDNFSVMLWVLGFAIFLTVLKIFIRDFTFPVFLDILVLGGVAALILSKKEIGKQILAVYAFVPIFATVIWGSFGNVIVWAFAFHASAQSLLIKSILDEKAKNENRSYQDK